MSKRGYSIAGTDRPTTPPSHDGMKIIVSKNGSCLVESGVPLIKDEVCNDDDGYCRKWEEVTRHPVQE